ncbi:MAG: hypothetical protein F9K40_04085 [Kofleriaceae bacterium]|nr:MAG: hypothetical protein F9K40_04085 [Kofleriaceae bacterium]MBZ0234543.1 hypothetical protein [Kofleriaceae bacterium]
MRGGRVRAQGSVRESFKLALRKAGLDTALRVHDARYTFASHWVMDDRVRFVAPSAEAAADLPLRAV